MRFWTRFLLIAVLGSCSEAAELTFRARETGGIQRRSDVVTARLSADRIPAGTRQFSLRKGGQLLPAQFTPPDQETGELVIDFIDHFGPFEAHEYTLHFGSAGPPPPGRGLTLEEQDDTFHVNSSGVVDWEIRRDLAGFLKFAWRQEAYVQDNSPGLRFVVAGEEKQLLSAKPPTRVSVERSGSVASELRFEYDNWPPGCASTVTLELVRTKSWVRARWDLSDPNARLQACSLDLDLVLTSQETYVDFEGGEFVYATVRPNESLALLAGSAAVPRWQVVRGRGEQVQPVVVAPADGNLSPIPGWAHAMDDVRCTAVAIDRFGEAPHDELRIDGKDRLSITRQFGSRGGQKSLEFWIHFVRMPVHIGARTSPRAMQQPLVVEWLD